MHSSIRWQFLLPLTVQSFLMISLPFKNQYNNIITCCNAWLRVNLSIGQIMKKKKLCWYFQQSSFFFSLCYLILLLSLLQSSFKWPWQGLLRAWIQNNFCFVPPCINIHQDKFWGTVYCKAFFSSQPRIDELNTQARQKNREVMTIQNQARGIREDSDRLKVQSQGEPRFE